MKRIIAMALAAMTAVSITGCMKKAPSATTNEWNYKTGLATYTHTNDTYGWTEDRNGQSAVSTTIVAAVFDNDGKIIDISIDEVESRTGFDATGQLTNYTGEEIISKKEMGNDYGMKAASGIGKEWYQQIESLEKWLIGKNAKNVFSTANGKINDIMDSSGANSAVRNGENAVSGTMPDTAITDGTAGGDIMDGINSAVNDMTDGGENYTGTTAAGWMDEDLRASVTIDTTNIQRTIEKAYRNAK